LVLAQPNRKRRPQLLAWSLIIVGSVVFAFGVFLLAKPLLVNDGSAKWAEGGSLMTVRMVREIAKQAWVDAIEVHLIIETLEAGNTSAAVAAVNAAGTDAVAKCVYRALWSRLVVIVTRAYSEARPGDRHAQYAFDLLKKPAVRSEVERMGSPEALAEAITLWGKCRGDHRWQSVDEFRDKQIAHWGSLKNPPPIINDVFTVSRKTAAALERLAQGTGVVTLSLNSQLTGYRDRADRFWGADVPSPPSAP
jgi:hypothetical protein